MLKWLVAAIWGPPEYVRGAIRALERLLESQNDEIQHLRNRLDKLQGRVTGGLRSAPNGKPSELPDVVEDLNEFIRQGGRPSVRISEDPR